jgi:hypothetical protein
MEIKRGIQADFDAMGEKARTGKFVTHKGKQISVAALTDEYVRNMQDIAKNETSDVLDHKKINPVVTIDRGSGPDPNYSSIPLRGYRKEGWEKHIRELYKEKTGQDAPTVPSPAGKAAADRLRARNEDIKAILNDVAPGTDVGAAFRAYNEFASKQYFDRFDKGATADVTRKGGQSSGLQTKAENIPTRFWGLTGAADLTRALGNRDAARTQMLPHATEMLRKASVDGNGIMDVPKAMKWLFDNKQTVDAYGMRGQMLESINGQLRGYMENTLMKKGVDNIKGEPVLSLDKSKKMIDEMVPILRRLGHSSETVNAFRDYYAVVQILSRNKKVSFSGGSNTAEKIAAMKDVDAMMNKLQSAYGITVPDGTPKTAGNLAKNLSNTITGFLTGGGAFGGEHVGGGGGVGGTAGALLGYVAGNMVEAKMMNRQASARQLFVQVMTDALFDPSKAQRLMDLGKKPTPAAKSAISADIAEAFKRLRDDERGMVGPDIGKAGENRPPFDPASGKGEGGPTFREGVTANPVGVIREYGTKTEKRKILREVNEKLDATEKDFSIDRGGLHSPSGPSDGSPLYDVTRNATYPDDVYTQDGKRYYSTGEDRMDSFAHSKILEMEGHPNRLVAIYRAVEKDSPSKINAGDWVTIDRSYAKEHGEGNINGGYKIIRMVVPARDIFTSGDSWLEWGYHPQTRKIEVKRPTPSGGKGDGTNTPEFRSWFGDSKVVDAEGKPLKVYHGTNADFDTFSKDKLGLVTKARSAKAGFFFTDNKDTASGYATLAGEKKVQDLIDLSERLERQGKWDAASEAMRKAETLEQSGKHLEGTKVREDYITIKKPVEFDAEGQRFLDIQPEIHSAIEKAKKTGADGLVIKNLDDNADWGSGRTATHYMVFEPTQIKSTKNQGTWNPLDANTLREGITSLPQMLAEQVKRDGAAKTALKYGVPVAALVAYLATDSDPEKRKKAWEVMERIAPAAMMGVVAKHGASLRPDGNITIKDANAIPNTVWARYSADMSRRGYDFRGPEDAKHLTTRFKQDGAPIELKGDHAAAMKKALRLSDAPVKEKTTTDKMFQKAIRRYGTTVDPNEAGYIIPSGSMLDFSGKREGGEHGTRAYDHRQVHEAFPGKDWSGSGYDAMTRFQNAGAIRVSGSTRNGAGMIDAMTKPTPAQEVALAKFIAAHRENGVYIDLDNGINKTAHIEPKIGASAGSILRQIREFFDDTSWKTTTPPPEAR